MRAGSARWWGAVGRAWLLAALLGGCGAAQPAAPPPPEVVLTPADLPGDFLVRQRITGEFGGRRVAFEAALQKRGGELTVVGLTPYGAKAFSLVQTGAEVRFTSYLPRDHEVPLRPRYLLADIHHAYFLRADTRRPAAAGWRPATHGPEYVYEEQTAEGALRCFRRGLEGGDARQVTVEHRGGSVGDFPRRVVLDNGYYGYRLEIETLTYQPLG